MMIYLLKFSACLFIFMLFYKLFLEKESFHRFKRFYLLGAILGSAVIPLITFTHYVDLAPGLESVALSKGELSMATDTTSQNVDYLPIILWSIYALGVLVFGVRFFTNLYQIYQRIHGNPNYMNDGFIHVLLKELLVPHTFFKYIFLNRRQFENRSIPQEVLLHEQIHAQEKHAADILFVELVQILLWFNPLLYLIKKDIKLNHEFLADQAVLKNGIDSVVYQNLLLEFSSSSGSNQLASAINYSLIKKRFTVMKTQSSKLSTWIRSIAILPLLAFVIYGFSSTKEIIKASENSNTEISDYTGRSIEIQVLGDGTYLIDGLKATKKSMASVVNELHQDITPEIRNRIMNIHVSPSNEVSNEEIWFIFNALENYGFHRLVAGNEEVIKSKGNTPRQEARLQSSTNALDSDSEAIQDGATKQQIKEYNVWAKAINQKMAEAEKKDDNGKWGTFPIVKQKDVKKFKHIYDNVMTEKQRGSVEPWPSFPPPPPPPPAENAPVVIEVNEVLPPPPPPIPENATPEQKKKYKQAIKAYKVKTEKAYNAASQASLAEAKLAEIQEQKQLAEVRLAERKELSQAQKEEMAEVKKARVAEMKVQREQLKQEKLKYAQERKNLSKEQKIKQEEMLKKREAELAYIKEAQLARSKRNPLDHIVDMAKKGATFYFAGKEISSDKAIEIAKSNKHLNIKSYDRDSKQPKVYLDVGEPVIKD